MLTLDAPVVPPLELAEPVATNGHDHALDSVEAPVVLDIQGLSAGYGDQFAIQNLTFQIRRGEQIGLLGPNGAGKSTLFKAIMGLLPASQGAVKVHGQAVNAHAINDASTVSRVAYVPQFNEIDWKFPVSVYDVVMMGRTRQIGWFRLPRRGDVHDQIVRDALERVNLLEFAARQIGDLSGGQKRRVFIARALAQEADILLLDEPFAGVDARAQHTILEVLKKLSQAGVTVILATHDLGMASSHFDKLILLNRELVAFGTPKLVFRPENLTRAFGGQLAIWREEVEHTTTEHTTEQMMVITDHCCA